MIPRSHLSLCLLLCSSVALIADGPKDNVPGVVRPVPPLGIEVPAAERASLEAEVKALRKAIDEAAKAQAKHPQLADLLPDIEVYHKAVDWALRFNEVFKPQDIKVAHEQLAEGLQRAKDFKEGKAPWTRQTGLVVRGYRSKIDGSVQPYGMVVPATGFDGPKRLDLWCHGRFENITELGFIEQRRKQAGSVQPADTLVLHPFGRFSCANKFAGEIDLFEAMAHAKKFYPIDNDRIIIRGFSMGGAAAWQFATHYADLWCGANPGAGFAETAQFLKVFQSEDVESAPWYQKKLWHMYDATDYALNLWHCPTVVYSGELDKQKQAADIMEVALRAEQMDMLHIIGPQTAHSIHPVSLIEIERRLADIAAAGRDRCPETVHFATWTLRYNRMRWLVVDALEEHWARCRVHAQIDSDRQVTIKTQNTAALSIDMPSGYCRMHLLERPKLIIDGQQLEVSRPKLDRSWAVHLRKQAGKWSEQLSAASEGLTKAHGLQGPIDDAFMSSFLIVKPSAPGWHEATGKWVAGELDHAQREWRKQFRGEAPVKADSQVTEADIASSNLILWGDPASNSVLAKVIEKLPIQWSKDKLTANGKDHNAATSMPALIFPNPLNPQRYIVLNSGFTYREYDYLNNARQVSKLPDWAIIDVTQPATAVVTGGIADAGFFDESWGWKAKPAK